jgi:hypothetical protein
MPNRSRHGYLSGKAKTAITVRHSYLPMLFLLHFERSVTADSSDSFVKAE